MKRTQRKETFNAEDLPKFSKDAQYLYPVHAPLLRHNLKAFLFQRQIALYLLLGAVLEVGPRALLIFGMLNV